MTHDAQWLAEFGPIANIEPWTDAEVRQHLHDLIEEISDLPVSVKDLVKEAQHHPRPDRRRKAKPAATRDLLPVIAARRARAKRLESFRWMHARGWRPEDIQGRLHLNTVEYDALLRQVS
jgi:hypothetical protein